MKPDTPPPPLHEFFTRLARIINSGQSRSVLLRGNVHDLFYIARDGGEGDYVPLIEFLVERCGVRGLILLVYELNGPIRIVGERARERVKEGWISWKSGVDAEQSLLAGLVDRRAQRDREAIGIEFENLLRETIGQPTVALEFLRQLAICSRAESPRGIPYIQDDFLILIEAADLILPAGDGNVANLAPPDRARVVIAQDWFCDPGFMNGKDSVVLIAENRSQINSRVGQLPQVLEVEVPSPDLATRTHYIEWFMRRPAEGGIVPVAGAAAPRVQLWAGVQELARFTAGLSIHALRQLMIGSAHSGSPLTPQTVVAKVEEFIAAQLGEDVVEFKKPEHKLEDLIGFTKLKAFLREELIPRFRATGPEALPGAAVAGPIGGGKTFIFEAAAGALDLPVLVLKNIRSQWFGQTDVILERLRRVLEALQKAIIFVDEADTQFGGVGEGVHDTERRLTGKIQQMMSDPKMRGRIIWLLMTARIHLLSPDIRRPGRVGDLIIPVLDPEGDDRREFIAWILKGITPEPPNEEAIKRLDALTPGYSAAAFTSLRSQLKARAAKGPLSLDQIEAVVKDHLQPAIGLTRRYQTLQALVNCTRRSLLPDPEITEEDRKKWEIELNKLEAMGIH